MSYVVHELKGCPPTPLLSYMKSLGILRLISETVDPGARGFWKNECFHLVTRLSPDELERFFLYEYAPSPLLSPWNKGSGFYSEKDAGLSPLENSKAARLDLFRRGIADARSLLADIARADAEVRAVKDEPKKLPIAQRDSAKNNPDYKARLRVAEKRFMTYKEELIPRCRQLWRGPHLDWFTAVVVLGEGEKRFPAMFGTGGNDGRLDFTNNYYQRLQELFDVTTGVPTHASPNWLDHALWGGAVVGARAKNASIGQYSPGGAGGANSSTGPYGDAFVNPWDFVLMLEGGLLFVAGAARRLDNTTGPMAVAPFSVPARNAGFGSASPVEEKNRGEQWLPLWGQPVVLDEVRKLLAEGRSRIGARGSAEPVDMVRAVARLGTARGVTGFERVGYLERNGQANLAVNLGRVMVPDHPSPNVMLLDDLDGWLERLSRRARDTHAPARLSVAERALGDTLFSAAQHPDEPARWQRVLLALAQVEQVMATGAGFEAGPIPPLQPGWLTAADDGSSTFRLALALALATDGGWRDSQHQGPVRHHWLPLRSDGKRFSTSGSLGSQRLLVGAEVVCFGRDPVRDLSGIVIRRLVEAEARGTRRLLLSAPGWATASLGDLSAYLVGHVDDEKLFLLAQALSALDRRQILYGGPPPAVSLSAPLVSDFVPDDPWLAIRLALLPPNADSTLTIPADPAIVRRLTVGDAPGAVELALRRLSAQGIRCVFQSGFTNAATAQRWAAALVFPISPVTTARIRRRLDRSLSYLQGENP